jgi:hypothetical protein
MTSMLNQTQAELSTMMQHSGIHSKPQPTQSDEILNQLCQILKTKSPRNLVRVAMKLERVVRAIPKME